MNWTSWIPALPSLSLPLPSSIQQRFVSFVLKRFLGHFLEPGQLDPHQIDSQLSSGYVQVKSLRLDPNAINTFLEATPLRLSEGTLRDVTLQAPWPSPLNAVSGLTVRSLELNLVASTPISTASPTEDLADSVANVAETFLHTELSAREEAELRQSFLEDTSSIPGDLDPFVDDPDANVNTESDEAEPQGVSIFASLIERVLLNFRFLAEDTKVTLVVPGLAVLTILIPRISYDATKNGIPEESGPHDLTAKLSLSGLAISIRDLRETSSSSDGQPSRGPSPASSVSSMNEETQAALSQSLAFLPAPSRSPASSMYASAASWLPPVDSQVSTSHIDPHLPQNRKEYIEAQLLSLVDGGLEISVTLPRPAQDVPSASAQSSSHFFVTCKIGSLACASQSWQLSLFDQLIALFSSRMQRRASPSPPEAPSQLSCSLSLKLNSFTWIAVLGSARESPVSREELGSFFHNPSLAIRISSDYLKLRADLFTLSLDSLVTSSKTVDVSIMDVHVVAFRWDKMSTPKALRVYPILISDFDLPRQYSSTHVHPRAKKWKELPSFVPTGSSSDPQDYDKYHIRYWRCKAEVEAQAPERLVTVQVSLVSPTIRVFSMRILPIAIKLDPILMANVNDFLSSGPPSSESHDSMSSPRPPEYQESSGEQRDQVLFTADMEFLRFQVQAVLENRRSGTAILDLHGLCLGNGSSSKDNFTPDHVRYSLQFDRMLGALQLPGKSLAESFISIGPLRYDNEDDAVSIFRKPTLYVFGGNPSSQPTISLQIPSIHGSLSKAVFDGLQYLADDASQSLALVSRDRRNEESTSLKQKPTADPFLVKLEITEGFFRVPLHPEERVAFELGLSEANLTTEVWPTGTLKVCLSVMDISIDGGELPTALISLTSARRLGSSVDSILSVTFVSSPIPGTSGKESALDLNIQGATIKPPLYHDIALLESFFRAPAGVFESVVPSERTVITCTLLRCSFEISPSLAGSSLVLYEQHLKLSTAITRNPEQHLSVALSGLTLLIIDDFSLALMDSENSRLLMGAEKWKALGYAPIVEIPQGGAEVHTQATSHPATKVSVSHLTTIIHLCADTTTAIPSLISGITEKYLPPSPSSEEPRSVSPARINTADSSSSLLASLESKAFVQPSEIGYTADLISDDLPTNVDYIDESFGTAAGLRELNDEDIEEFDIQPDPAAETFVLGLRPGVSSRVGGETVKMLTKDGLGTTEDHFVTLTPETTARSKELGTANISIQVDGLNAEVKLYDGYDWLRTRKAIEDEMKNMRRRLARIRQLLASGQLEEPLLEDASSLLFKSVHLGLHDDLDLDDPAAVIAAIDDELEHDVETATQSSWQSLRPTGAQPPPPKSIKISGRRLTRSRKARIEFRLSGGHLEFSKYEPAKPAISRLFVSLRELEILDYIKISTWQKFMTSLRSDSQGNVRESGSNMVQIELVNVHPVEGHPSEEARLRARILPLRLYVDQLAVDFLKQFFSFQADEEKSSSSNDGTYFQLVEVFPIDIKLDYKPRHIDYKALKAGRTIELMNFFHFDGAEMTLRHITLAGISGWPRLFDLLNDLWTPDVKATQLVDVISGVSPIRSVVNVGSGVADLVLLPIAQYKKDGRIIRGVQKGTKAFIKSTAIEAIKLGAQLATGTQVILEQTEDVVGGQFKEPILTEAMEPSSKAVGSGDDEDSELISRYADQPMDLREGLQSAYQSLRRNLNSAAQTILAVPMEMHEREGSEGPVRSVIRAVPIAVLKPMIGATEAVSKTLLGLHNTLDPGLKYENEAKYKRRA